MLHRFVKVLYLSAFISLTYGLKWEIGINPYTSIALQSNVVHIGPGINAHFALPNLIYSSKIVDLGIGVHFDFIKFISGVVTIKSDDIDNQVASMSQKLNIEASLGSNKKHKVDAYAIYKPDKVYDLSFFMNAAFPIIKRMSADIGIGMSIGISSVKVFEGYSYLYQQIGKEYEFVINAEPLDTFKVKKIAFLKDKAQDNKSGESLTLKTKRHVEYKNGKKLQITFKLPMQQSYQFANIASGQTGVLKQLRKQIDQYGMGRKKKDFDAVINKMSRDDQMIHYLHYGPLVYSRFNLLNENNIKVGLSLAYKLLIPAIPIMKTKMNYYNAKGYEILLNKIGMTADANKDAMSNIETLRIKKIYAGMIIDYSKNATEAKEWYTEGDEGDGKTAGSISSAQEDFDRYEKYSFFIDKSSETMKTAKDDISKKPYINIAVAPVQQARGGVGVRFKLDQLYNGNVITGVKMDNDAKLDITLPKDAWIIESEISWKPSYIKSKFYKRKTQEVFDAMQKINETLKKGLHLQHHISSGIYLNIVI